MSIRRPFWRDAFARDPFSGEHGRARQLAALRMSEPLEPADEAWLEDHLGGCQACRSVAEAYEGQRLALRRLPTPEPPRDLWARTAVALDEAERRSTGEPAADRDTAPGATVPAPRQRRRGRDASPALLGTAAAALVIVVVAGSTLLAGALRPGPSPVGAPSLAVGNPPATPIAVQPGRVVWATHEDDGTYALNIAPVNHVCPSRAAEGCAPLDSSARKLVALAFRPKAVVLAQNRPEAVVVGPAAQSNGTSVFVVSLPADSTSAAPSATAAGSAGTETPAGSATAQGTATRPTSTATSASTTPATTASVTPARSPAIASATASATTAIATAATPTVEGSAVGSSSATGSGPSATAVAPSPAATIAILDNVVLSDEAAYSPDGAWFAFSARPADGSRGPDIYVWRVGEAEAHAITTDHSSIFSAWAGNRILGSTVTAEAAPGSEMPSQSASAPPSAPISPSPSEKPTGANSTGAKSTRPSPSASTRPSTSPRPGKSSPAASLRGPAAATSTPVVSPELSEPPAESPSVAPDGSTPDGGATLVPRSFAVDPRTGIQETLGEGIWRPVVDPTGTLVLYWRGTLAFDPASSSWQPAQGDLYLAAWSSVAPPDLLPGAAQPSESPSGSPTASPAGSPAVSPSRSASASPSRSASGSPVVSRAASPSARTATPPTRAASSPSATPPRVAKPLTSPPTVSAASATASDAGSSPSEESSSESAGGSPSPSGSPLAPVLLGPTDPPTGTGPTIWDARWDASGRHLAIWVADPVDPAVGRLSLLTVDPASARTDPSASLLVAAPALPGFSVDFERLAWVTPRGQDGHGSQLQVLGWQGDAAGTIESLPIPDSEQLIVAR